MEIELFQGDIADCEADAIVNAANDRLWMGSGVAGAIKRKGGREIEDEAVSKGPIPIGEAIVTGAGRLKARYVIHAAGMGQDLLTSAKHIRDSTMNSLLRANELGLESVVFPLIGSGVGGFPAGDSARIMLSAVREFAGKKTSIEKVTFAVRDPRIYKTLKDALEESGNRRGP